MVYSQKRYLASAEAPGSFQNHAVENLPLVHGSDPAILALSKHSLSPLALLAPKH